MTTTRLLEMLHMDLFGPITYISIEGNKYGLVIIDDYSRYTLVFFYMTRVKCMQPSRSLQRELKMNLS
uniref:Integrase catalytic domain-containing protein n=1 Tax=Arundo donax TaxID=35708 RepID=A0A0A9HT73_ARUDO